MQKLSPGYILTKLILFTVFELIGACLSIMFLYVCKDSGTSPSVIRILTGAIGLFVQCIMIYRMIMTAKLSGIRRGNYLLGECLSALVFLILTLIVCLIAGNTAMYEGFTTTVFLPVLIFFYLTKNLYLGLALHLIFHGAFVAVCYEIKRKKDPSLLGRKKGTE
ncbi:MAG: hypothetical protein E7616_07105 [Ruminococcaceae bacterium]|nr:hypothetical protein [Oscillospiraceae bacterium]